MNVISEGIMDRGMPQDIRVAYITSTREFAREEPMQQDDGMDISQNHRGSLPALIGLLSGYNRSRPEAGAPAIQMSLILMDDDIPERDFSDLGCRCISSLHRHSHL